MQKHFSKPTELLLKFLTEGLSDAEMIEFQKWIEADPKHKILFDTYNNSSLLAEEFKEAGFITDELRQSQKELLYQKLFEKGTPEKKNVFHIGYRKIWWRRIAVGAGIIGIALLAWQYGWRSNGKPDIVKNVVTPNNPVPGTDKAVLVLADGRKLTLQGASSHLAIDSANNVTSIDASEGIITYGQTGVTDPGKTATNSLITPKGGQYKLRLSDGSLIYLNAASSVTYPTTFSPDDKTREISISGEVYLQVAKDKSRPFIVHVNNSYDVRVLGTSFTINAYTDEPFNKTTLVEGSVQMTSTISKKMFAIQLKPGEQALISPSTAPTIKRVDVDEATAFARGLFYFSDDDIQSVARQLARWYNVEVSFEGPLSTKTLNGYIQRSLPLQEVIDMLNGMGADMELKAGRLIIRS